MQQLKNRARLALTLGFAASLALTNQLSAQQVNDVSGDWASTYTGAKTGDLDVLSSEVFFDGSKFAFTATFAGPIRTTPTAFYVWGINRGSPTAQQPFSANGAPNVRFDATVVLRPGTGVTAANAAVNDFFWWSGNTLTAVVPMSFLGLVNGGFASREQFTWNLWPRDGSQAGGAAISDFAPDNAMAPLTLSPIPQALLVTPEPASFVLVGAGMLVVGLVAKRRRA